MKTLGLIRGMSWESSAVYYQIINRRAKELLGGSHSARSLMYSVDFADVEKRQHDENWADLELIMIDAAQRLERGGANFIVICTNTMHIFADQIEASVNIPLLHIGDATGEALQRAGIRKAALFGTKFTMERPFLRDRLEERCGIETIIPSASDREMIHSVIYGELVKWQINENSRAAYLESMARTVNEGAEGIILGCTEIPLLVTQEMTDTPLFDTTRLHAEKAVEWVLRQE